MFAADQRRACAAHDLRAAALTNDPPPEMHALAGCFLRGQNLYRLSFGIDGLNTHRWTLHRLHFRTNLHRNRYDMALIVHRYKDIQIEAPWANRAQLDRILHDPVVLNSSSSAVVPAFFRWLPERACTSTGACAEVATASGACPLIQTSRTAII